jgi:hypothetical protein
MKRVPSALAAFSLSSVLIVSAASQIDDPKNFVTEVYRRFVAAESTHSSYKPPDDIYTARLGKLLRDDKRRAKGEVGCLDFVFWINAQDWRISQLNVTADEGRERRTVIAKFLNTGEPQEIQFDFLHNTGRWLLDDVHSVSAPPWTLSEILKCAP